ncbi:MAG: glycosyltransferase [Oscillospiraceae bacterium]|jgi:glycosyltransferase involved in cell wall biosynthesis|nr:glycosyltransferase [Oscillospiraceae bacterium]
MKIYVYAICRNEKQFAERWYDSVAEADGVYVTDTGSTDGTVERLRTLGATVYEEAVEPFRFDVARNLALSHVPEDADICVSVDLDEVFERGWRAELESAWTRETTIAGYYICCHNPDGSEGASFLTYKAHSRTDYRWRYPTHEVLMHVGDSREVRTAAARAVLRHFPDTAKPRTGYLPLLELGAAESPGDSRMQYYLAREYLYAGRHADCAATARRYLDNPASVWDEERASACGLAADAMLALGNLLESYRWRYRAIAEAPQLREPYTELAKLALSQGEWELSLAMCVSALKIESKSATFINSGDSWNSTLYDVASVASYWLDLYGRSLSLAETALTLDPTSERIRANVELISAKLSQADRRG